MRIELDNCPFQNYFWSGSDCLCPKKLFKNITKTEHVEKCEFTYDNSECKMFLKMQKIYREILTKNFNSHLELQSMMNMDERNCINNFIRKVAEEYYCRHYRDKYVENFVKRFKQKMGVALAVECIENESCPYISIAKDIVKPLQKE